MSIKNISSEKRIVKNTLLLYIRQLLVLAIGLYTTRLTLQVLGEKDYGVYAAVGGVTALLSLLAGTLSSGTQRFITFELGKQNIEKLNIVYITSVNIHIVLSLILIILGETIGSWFVLCQMTLPQDRLWVAFWVFQITLFNSVFTLVNVPNNAEIIAHEDMGIYALITITDTVLKFISVVLLFYISWDKLVLYSLFLFAIQTINRFICLWFCKRKYIEVRYRWVFNKKMFKEMLSLSGWAGMSNLSVTGFVQGVIILLNIFFGPSMNAAYAIAMQAYSGLRTFCSSFQLASNPQIIKLYSANEVEKMKKLVYSVCKMSFALIFLISLPFLMNSSYILNLWLDKVPPHANLFFVLMLIYAYTDVLVYPLDIAAQATGKISAYSIAVSIGVLITLPIAYVAYTLGAFAESIYLIAIFFSWMSLFARLILLNRLVSIDVLGFSREVLLRIIIVAVLSVSLPLLYKYYITESLKSIIICFIICIINTLFITYFCGLNHEEREFCKGSLSIIISKYNNRYR